MHTTAMGDTERPEVGSRLDFIRRYVLKSLKLKEDKWEKLLSSEDNEVLRDFLDRGENRSLAVSVSRAGLLRPSAEFRASREKTVYFLKLNRDTMEEQLACGELCSAPLDQLSVVIQEVRSSESPGEQGFVKGG